MGIQSGLEETLQPADSGIDRLARNAAGGQVLMAGATPIYDNGGPNTTDGYSIFQDEWTADDFMLASNGSIGGVGFYFQNYFGITGWSQDIDYLIRR